MSDDDRPPLEAYEGFTPTPGGAQRQTPRESGLPAHLPPQNLDAEEAILGAMMIAVSALKVAMELGLEERDFYRPSHRVLHRVIHLLFERDGQCDELTVVNELRAVKLEKADRDGLGVDENTQDALAYVGGAAAVISLVQRVPSVANSRAYAQEVIDVAAKRRMVETGHELARLGYDLTITPDEQAEQAEQMLHQQISKAGRKHQRGQSFDNDESLRVWSDEYAMMLEDPDEYLRRTLSWGSVELDDRIGRMEPGDVFVLTGWTKHGKTWQALDTAEHVIDQGARVLIASGEMNDGALMSRFVAMGGHDHDAVREKRVPWSVLKPRIEVMKEWDRRTLHGTMTVARIRSEVTRARLEGRPFRFVVLDHLGLLRQSPGQRFASRREFVEDACAELKAMAEEYGFTLLLLSQLSRPPAIPGTHPEYKRQPVSTDLKEASGIEQIATTIVFVYRHMDKETGRQLDDCSARLSFPFHRHKRQPRSLETVFEPPSEVGTPAYRFVPAKDKLGGVDHTQALVPTVPAQQTLAAVQETFGPGVTLVSADDDEIPF